MRSRLIALFSFACTLSISAAAQTPSPPAGPHPEEAAILAVVDKFMDAISNNDSALMSEIRAKEGFEVVTRTGQDGTPVVRRRVFDPGAVSKGTSRERYWDPIVHVRGAIAVVWTPYEFWSNGKTSHCGIDVFDLYKEQGAWKISHAMWTVEPDACPSLRPAHASRVRPAR
jgi:hypothetical protein